MHNCNRVYFVSHQYIPRALEPVLRKAASQFPAVVLVGARQSGKTTLLKHVFGEGPGYVSLEPPDIRASAAADPRGFLEMHPPPVIFDEVQHAPDLLPYIKERIDERRNLHGQYLLDRFAELVAYRPGYGIAGGAGRHAAVAAPFTTGGG